MLTTSRRKCSRLPVIAVLLFQLLSGMSQASVDYDYDSLATTASTELKEDEADIDETEIEAYLSVDEDLRDQELYSGDRLTFRCRISGSPKEDMQFTWYKDNQVLTEGADNRVTIKKRDWGSRLQVLDLFSTDSGTYRCEASNGIQRDGTSAEVNVRFSRPPGSADDNNFDKELFEGKCEIYKGYACSQYLTGKYIYVDSFQTQKQLEQHITTAMAIIGNKDKVSESCSEFARPAFCHFIFPLCEKVGGSLNYDEDLNTEYSFEYADAIVEETDLNDKDGKATAIKLCREDCELLKHEVCRKEFATEDELVKQLVKAADCSSLPKTTASPMQCTKLGLRQIIDRNSNCYNDTGTRYQGVVNLSQTGAKCRPWPSKMLNEYPELAGGHNFCRNPGNAMDQPWCFTDRELIQKEMCNVNKCKSPGGTSDLLMILIPCVSIPLLLGCIMLVMCFVCRNGRKKEIIGETGKKVELRPMSTKKFQVPEIPSSVVHYLLELGEGKFGKVYKAQILNNMHYFPQGPVAVKTLSAGMTHVQVEEFQREIDVFSDIQHQNVSCLKAVVLQPAMRCMVFEYTNRIDLHELLTLHSPHSDVGGGKVTSSSSSQASSTLEPGDFVHMAVQIAAGMDYLTSCNFIHRDLAARNILVCNNNVMKISNLGVVRDCYLSSYYRSPQGGHMLPVRWMAPESLNSNQFSEKSAVWSFGVLLWEMFSYGLQPYCGYSNHEVLEMISRLQTLSCPDQCPARMYSLMQESWGRDPMQRPSFKNLQAKLSGWEGSSTTRMTSQLAQGIHRQLNNVMREGGGQFGQYAPPQGTVIDGSSFNNPQYITTSPLQPGPTHASPASQNYYSSPTGTSSSGPIPGHPPSYPNYMQQSFPVPLMYPQPQNHYARPHPESFPYKSSNTHSSSESCTSSSRNQYQHAQAYQPQQFQREHNPNDMPQSQHHFSGNQANVLQQPLNQRVMMDIPEYENLQRTPDSGVHSAKDSEVQQQSAGNGGFTSSSASSQQNSGYNPSGSSRPRPGSEVMMSPGPDVRSQSLSIYNNSAGNVQHQSHDKPTVAPKPPISPLADVVRPRVNIAMGVNGQRNRNHNNHIENSNVNENERKRLNSNDKQSSQGSSPSRPQSVRKSNHPGLSTPAAHLDISDMHKQRNSTTSGDNINGKAMSCDSGLPGDEPDPEVTASENQPFIAKQPVRPPYSMKSPLLLPPGSSSSSVSGSTAITIDSRLTT